jgi:demethylmenaquinone methyltransferase/2-methoxy-6-polyprenyl-1,4-benzoquinol methylase
MQAENSQSSGVGEGVDFGFEQVDPAEKTRRVHGVFERVARRYDLMNDLMSGGIHRLWKESLVDQVRPRDDLHILDVAGGTGDIAFRMLRRAPDARVTICDLTEDMLRVGRDRALDRGRVGVDWVTGNAEALPFPDMSVDAYTIAFGLRNVSDRPAALAEARRVLRPGGRFFCLEFSRITTPMIERLYERYSFEVVPRVGQVVVGDGAPYQYLVESIRQFPDQDALAELMSDAGLEQVAWRNLSGGIAAIHSGWRL